jgi:hypothetical protein
MSNAVVPYMRFLEVRRRRQRVHLELTRTAVAPANADSLPPEPPGVAGAIADAECGTRTEAEGPTACGVRPGAADDNEVR